MHMNILIYLQMKTFNVRQCETVEELTNGVAMSQALYQM